MDAREQRGLVIAATCKIEKATRGRYFVPSQSKAGDIHFFDRALRVLKTVERRLGDELETSGT